MYYIISVDLCLARIAMLKCAIGIMAYNEEKNIGHLLEALFKQKLTKVKITDICVVSSGSSDETDKIVREFSRRDPRIRLLTQIKREGKASAVNFWLRNVNEEILILESADTIPGEETIEKLVEPFFDREVGMTGGRPIPINNRETFIGFAVHFLWLLHHKIALKSPKLGEIIAFRKVFTRLHPLTSVDEANIEPIIRAQGYKLKYVPQAIISNKGSETISDFIRQRRRIYAGHLAMKKEQGYSVSTLSPWRILKTIVTSPELFNIKYLLWTPGVIFLEAYSRFLGSVDFKNGKDNHVVWEIASTTKNLVVPSRITNSPNNE